MKLKGTKYLINGLYSQQTGDEKEEVIAMDYDAKEFYWFLVFIF